MLKLFLIFFKIGLLTADSSSINEKLHDELVLKAKLLNEDEWNSVSSVTKFPYGSIKMSYAIAVSKYFSQWPIGILLGLVSIIPNALLTVLIYYLLQRYLNSEQLNIIINAVFPVLSAYLIYCGYQFLKESFMHFALIKYVPFLLYAFIMVFVLEINILLVLVLSLFLFLCFLKGGRIDE